MAKATKPIPAGPRRRRPTHPGEIMAEILEALGLNKAEAARRMGVSRPTLYDVLRGDRPLTVEVALRFGRLAGTSPDVLVRMQAEVDLWDERERLAAELAKIKSARKDEAA